MGNHSSSHEPTPADIMTVRALFCQTSPPLPVELVDDILDSAEYWARSSITLQWPDTIPGVRRDGGNEQIMSDKMYMRMPPLGMVGVDSVEGYSTSRLSQEVHNNIRGEHPCRKIVFDIRSHDQGWGGDAGDRGTYRGSYTWFDVSVERPSPEILDGLQISDWPTYALYHESDSPRLHEFHFTRRDPEHPFLPPATHLQRNVTASSELRWHSVTWHYNDSIEEGSPAAQAAENRGQGWRSLDGTFVRSLRAGDCITLWGRARFPGWRLSVESVTITVYFAV